MEHFRRPSGREILPDYRQPYVPVARGNTYIFKVSNEPLSLTDKFFTISEHLNDKELKKQLAL